MASQCYIVSGIPRGKKLRTQISIKLKSKAKADKLKKSIEKDRRIIQKHGSGMQTFHNLRVEKC